jgi:hypothetical protein
VKPTSNVHSPTADALPRSTEQEIRTSQLSTLPDPCSSAELAAVLGKSPKTVVDWCQERAYTHIPCFRLGNRWYHRPAELIRWLNGIKSGQVEFRRKPRNSAERR